ncbi:MAG TPA: hypothetical protein VF713_20385, partial [Thermoanaerobaculia bacterium]
NKAVNTILESARGQAARVSQNGNKRPDAARIDRVTNGITVWELKPRSYDPAFGGSARHGEAVMQLGLYISALHPAQFGRGTELHPRSNDRIDGEVVNRDGSLYEMVAYLGLGADRGVIYYRLESMNRRKQQSLAERTVETAKRALPCVATFVGVGVAGGALGGAAIGGTVGVSGGTFVAPGVGTVGGGVGGAAGGAIIGGIGGGLIGLGQGLSNCY